jgi:hypothetical protein
MSAIGTEEIIDLTWQVVGLLGKAHGSASSPFGTAIVAVLVPVTGAMVAAPVASTTSGPLG